MKIKALVLGNDKIMRNVSNSLLAMGIEVVRLYEIPETITVLKQERFNIAVVDSTIEEVANVCFRLIWICRMRVVLMTEETQTDFDELQPLGIDAFISDQYKQDEFATKISAIAQKGNHQFDKINVLVIEDDKNIREAIRMFFRIFWPEAELTLSDEGFGGVNIAKNKSMDIVLLDLGLPDMNGFEVLNWIRGFSNVPIIILTANRDKEQIVRAIQSGANDYVVKPFKQIELMLRIRKAINQVMLQGVSKR